MKNSFLKEPLIHFILIGAGLFLLFSLVSEEERDYQIIIDEYDLNQVVSKWKLQWQRDPTEAELKGLMDSYIKQEILYKEALALNLDHNDEIIKRRMAQKMKFLTEDLMSGFEINEKELNEYYEQNREKYKKEDFYSFEQVYFSPDVREDPYSDAIKEKGEDKPKGDPSSLKHEYKGVTLYDIRRELGKNFIDSLIQLEVNKTKWQGPISSGLGVHLIQLYHKELGSYPKLEEVKQKVEEDYLYDYEQAFNEQLMEQLLKKYEVVFDLENDTLFSE